MNKKKKDNLKSLCCRAKVKIGGMDNPIREKGIVTCYYVCTKCNKACDIYIPIRKTWTRNPKTQIIPNKEKKKSTKLTPKELKEIHNTQDF